VTTPVSKLARVTVGPDGELLDNKKNAKEGDKPDGSDAAKAANSLASNSPADKKPAEAKPEEADAEKAKAAAAKPDDKVKDAYGFTAADRQKRVFGATQFGGLTALLVAARDGQVNAVNAFLDAGVDVNRTSDTDHATPLILAVINGHYDLAKVLLDRGANPRSATTDGATALYAVIDVQWAPHTWYAQPIVANEHIGYLDVISALLMHGADPNAAIGKKLWFRSFANDETWFDVEGATPFLRGDGRRPFGNETARGSRRQPQLGNQERRHSADDRRWRRLGSLLDAKCAVLATRCGQVLPGARSRGECEGCKGLFST
jgi:hypothetical protein